MIPEKSQFNVTTNHYSWLTLSAIAMLFGMQTLRVFFPGLMWSISRDPTLAQLLIIILIVFGLPMPVLYLLHSIELRKLFLFIVIGQVSARLLEQISQGAKMDFFISAIGIFFFVSFFCLAWLYAPDRALTVGIGILVGILLDSTLRGSLWTLDLSWQKGLWTIGLVLVIGLAQVFSAMNTLGFTRTKKVVLQFRIHSYRTPLVLSFGLFLFLQQHIFQDMSQIMFWSGWSFPRTLVSLIIANLFNIGLALITVQRQFIRKSWIIYCAVVLLSLLAVDYFSSGNLFVPMFFLGSLLISILFVMSLNTEGTHLGSTYRFFLMLWGAGILLYVVLVVLYYITFTSPLFIVMTSIAFILLNWISLGKFSTMGLDAGAKLPQNKVFYIVLLILVLPAPFLVMREGAQVKTAAESLPADTIKILSINMHQGFDAFGNMAIFEQAQVIKASNADLISMNEVSRGWLLDGSLDMYVWLSHELNMYSSFGSAMGHLNGNAIFSKIPLTYSKNTVYSNDPSSIPRGYLHIMIPFRESQLNIISTHLAWANAGAVARDLEARELAGKFQARRTLIMGDMNAFPDSSTIRIFKDAGFIDAFTVTGQGTGNTWHALEPIYRLDYVFGSKDIRFVNFKIINTAVSDHLPILITVLR